METLVERIENYLLYDVASKKAADEILSDVRELIEAAKEANKSVRILDHAFNNGGECIHCQSHNRLLAILRKVGGE